MGTLCVTQADQNTTGSLADSQRSFTSSEQNKIRS